MERHEDFGILIAAASLGEANGEELARLEAHLGECMRCRGEYAEALRLASMRVLSLSNGQEEISSDEALGYIDSAQFRERFLRQAEREGILPNVPSPFLLPAPAFGVRQKKIRWSIAIGVAATLLLAAGLFAAYRTRSVSGSQIVQVRPTTPVNSPSQAVHADSAMQARSEQLRHLEEENQALAAKVAALQESLAKETSDRDSLKSSVASSEAERAALRSDAKERDAKLEGLNRELAQAETEASDLRKQFDQVRGTDQAALASDQLKIRDLTQQLTEQSATLDREREMLQANRDIRDLMSARNLHIADVFDTDSAGKTRAAFGRVFFTEGKSLIIYAYDLNDKRVEEAGYHFRVWGKREGPGQQAKSLGIFYSDDKAQKRWVFKSEDAKILSEIDSVFVTLEAPGKTPTRPSGDKFLYAYLKNQPNHP